MQGELTRLALYHCKIGESGAEIVADFLKHDETLNCVALVGCKIGLRGLKAIASALKQNNTVESVDLSSNQIEKEGAAALIDSLERNVRIKWLSTLQNYMSTESKITISYLTGTRNAILIFAAVRRASLCLIAARRTFVDAGRFALLPKEIVRMIAMEVWGTRKDPKWIEALSEAERTGK